MARTGCAFAAVTCLCCPARTHRDRQVLPAYGLQDLPIKTQNPSRGSKPNTMWLPITLGESLGRGHFYLAETRTFLLCVDSGPELEPTVRRSSSGADAPALWRGCRDSQKPGLGALLFLHDGNRNEAGAYWW